MIAWLLRWLWCMTIIAAWAAASISIDWLGASIGPWAAGLAGVLVIALIHPAAIACEFAWSRLAGDPVPPEHRLSPWQALVTYDAEIDASMRGFWFATPFLAKRPAARPASGSPVRPVALLFIHGYFCNRAIWLSFMRDAAARGYVCEAVTLPRPFDRIEVGAGVIPMASDALLARTHRDGRPASRVVLIGHSMGGLAIRSALQSGAVDRSRIAHVITLGTPHHGTRTAAFGTALNIVQMRPDSPWLRELAEAETRGDGLSREQWTTIFSYHDDIVFPQRTGRLEGARQIALSGIGHVSLAYHARVREIVFERLAEVDAFELDR
jgi:pimeloyl-ACP methyl ester carboxylesterase